MSIHLNKISPKVSCPAETSYARTKCFARLKRQSSKIFISRRIWHFRIFMSIAQLIIHSINIYLFFKLQCLFHVYDFAPNQYLTRNEVRLRNMLFVCCCCFFTGKQQFQFCFHERVAEDCNIALAISRKSASSLP